MTKIEHIVHVLRIAREKKGLSQRALRAKVGLPQSHISNIERGAVDLKTSSLIELARALDLELMLVPRQLEKTVKALGDQMIGEDDDAPPPHRLKS